MAGLEGLPEVIKQLAITSDKGYVIDVFKLLKQFRTDIPKELFADTIADVQRRLDLNRAELDRYLIDPTLFPGFIGRCKPEVRDGWIKDYLEYTEGHEGPEEFHFWVAISVIGGALRRNVYHEKDYYRVFPNHFIVLVAPSGRCRKSTCIDIGVGFLRRVDCVHIISEKITPEALAESLGRMKIDGTKVIPDSTGYLSAPELTVFLGRQQYNEGLIVLLTRLYDCPENWEYETRTKKHVKLHNVALSLIGGTTHDWLADAIPQVAFGGGFMSRIIFVVKNDTPRVFPRPKMERPELRDKLILGIQEIATRSGVFKMTPTAELWFDDWYAINRRIALKHDQRMSYYFERKPDHLIRLSLVMAISEHRDVLDDELMGRCLRLLDRVEEAMPDAFSEIEASDSGRNNIKILKCIQRHGGFMTHQELSHNLYRYFNKATLGIALEMLDDSDLITIEFSQNRKSYSLTDRGKAAV